MVNHLTRVTFDARSPRAAALEHALSELGFALTHGARHVTAESTVTGGREAKEALRARGFKDREFQIFLEYVRQWGML